MLHDTRRAREAHGGGGGWGKSMPLRNVLLVLIAIQPRKRQARCCPSVTLHCARTTCSDFKVRDHSHQGHSSVCICMSGTPPPPLSKLPIIARRVLVLSCLLCGITAPSTNSRFVLSPVLFILDVGTPFFRGTILDAPLRHIPVVSFALSTSREGLHSSECRILNGALNYV